VVEELGADGYLYGSITGSGDEAIDAQQIVARISARVQPPRGSTVRLAAADPNTVHVFSEKTGLRIS
jgi:multiple sugar transport system ATP-binding protein